jgi:acetylornithine deacetylase/succinyl-diaminopimelate desuccinylase-like protein
MMTFDKFQEHAKRILGIASHSESGNEELARYLQSLMHDYGMKTQLQPVSHSSDEISKRQVNLVGFVGDSLVDRSTRRGAVFINPLDVSTGNLPHLWTATQGNPQAPVANEQGIVGAGAVQGKLDFLCRIFAALDLVDKRLKSPVYLVGTCGSYHGMMGTRFLIESLVVNPKEVYTFAPTQMNVSKECPGQVAYRIDLEAAMRDRDSRGYNRNITITAYGLGVDFSTPRDSINALDLLMDLLLSATEQGFDFQWSLLETKGASGTNPDLAVAQISLTSFQLEDFKQFLRNRIGTEDQERFYRIDFSGISESGTRFIPSEMIEVILELDHEWKNFVNGLNRVPSPRFELPESAGNLVRIFQKATGKVAVGFELRFLPENDPVKLDEQWRDTVKSVSEKFERIHFSVIRDYLIPGMAAPEAAALWNTNYLSDAGLFHKAKFPVNVIGSGSIKNIPKGPNEAIRWSELERAIETYRELMTKASQG